MATTHASMWIWLSGLLFAAVHSGLASLRAKHWAYQAGWSAQRYRLGYTLTALLATALWLGFVYQLPDRPLYSVQGWPGWLMTAAQLAGLAVAVYSLRAFDAGQFLGLAPTPDGVEPFHERGIYRHLRHPMYAGIMLALLASPVQTVNSIQLAGVICLYFMLGARFEEGRMLASHPNYADYRRRVPAFVPRCRRLGGLK